jgi:protocatechuate 3,4-dioxygenase beta subunit
MANDPLHRPPIWRAVSAARLDRRRVLTSLAAGAAGALASSRIPAQSPGTCLLTPDSGEGPFYFDPELVRVDIAEDRPGAPLELSIEVVRAGDCATLDGARVDVWHADAIGLYSGYGRQRGTGEPSYSVEGQTFLRGTQFTAADGNVAFRTIYPSWYGGRTPHVHFKIFLGGDEVVASQLFFPDEFNNEVFERFEPYRERRERRRAFNDNDTFLRGTVVGAFCDVERTSSGYKAEVVVTVGARSG